MGEIWGRYRGDVRVWVSGWVGFRESSGNGLATRGAPAAARTLSAFSPPALPACNRRCSRSASLRSRSATWLGLGLGLVLQVGLGLELGLGLGLGLGL